MTPKPYTLLWTRDWHVVILLGFRRHADGRTFLTWVWKGPHVGRRAVRKLDRLTGAA